MLTLDEQFNTASALHHSGSLGDAERMYNGILAVNPNHADTLHLLGILYAQTNRRPASIDLLAKACALSPQHAQYFADFALALHFIGRSDEAIVQWQKSLMLRPNHAHTVSQLASTLLNMGRPQDAEPLYRHLLALIPNDPARADALNNLGIVLLQLNRPVEAIPQLQDAVALNPNFPSAQCNLGFALRSLRRMPEAMVHLRNAVSLAPNFANAHINISATLNDLQQFAEAEAAARTAISLDPKSGLAYFNLGNAVVSQRRLDEAIPLLRQAVVLQPRLAIAHTAISYAFLMQGKIDEALQTCTQALLIDPDMAEVLSHRSSLQNEIGECDASLADIRRAVQLVPTDPGYHSNLILSMQYHPKVTDADILAECKSYAAKFTPFQPRNHRDATVGERETANRPLRIGYVSADFRDNIVGRNVLPLFQHHDRSKFEIFCYSNSLNDDAFTERFQSLGHHWRNIGTISDEDAAKLVADDQIDILIDLHVHSAKNRLPLFALKPAPIQMTFAGYPGGTGLSTMDYRITDAYLDPPALDGEGRYVEKPLRLPCFWCFDPAAMATKDDPAPGPLPVLANGFITFSSLTATCKLNPQTLTLWSKVLTAVPTSRLHLLVASPSYRQKIQAFFALLGIEPSRLTFIPRQPRDAYILEYQKVDIALDTLPYNGHSTTLESLYMGVPTITLLGPRTVGRAGLSILSNLNLQHLTTCHPDEFITTALTLATNLPQLQSLRATLRTRMSNSLLTNGKLFTQNIEQLYRQAWQNDCPT